MKGFAGYSETSPAYGDREIYFDDFRIVIEEAPEMPDVPTISGISMEKTTEGIKVSSDVELTAAKLIFVTYDGNGRMSRLLTLLLLYRAGYIVGKYISLEKMIEENQKSYYEKRKKGFNQSDGYGNINS